MDFHYHPILGLQWSCGHLYRHTFYLIDEVGHYPIPKDPYIMSNTNFITRFKKIKFIPF